jgi:hypothetical protein
MMNRLHMTKRTHITPAFAFECPMTAPAAFLPVGRVDFSSIPPRLFRMAATFDLRDNRRTTMIGPTRDDREIATRTRMAATQHDRRIRQHSVLGPIGEVAEVAFTIDGETISGLEGDTVASALLAAGRRVFRTMPKTGEARGGFCLVGRCVDCLMIVDGVPSVRACRTPIAAGMAVRTQHGLGDWHGKAAS